MKDNNTKENDADQDQPTFVGIDAALAVVFRDESTRPSLRTWNEWRLRGYYPYLKVGRRVYINPAAARKALEKRFTVKAEEL